MNRLNSKENSFSTKLQHYFENYPGRCCDVSFVVGNGDQKEIIQSSRIILEVGCPEFMKLFDENSPHNPIPLPNLDPKAFKIFLKFLVLDDLSKDFLVKFNVFPKDLLNVVELCRKYKMPKLQEKLEIMSQETLFGGDFPFTRTEEFLALPKHNLNTLLCCEKLNASEIDIFDAAIRWADRKCSERRIENTRENIREILGDSFFRIRFPTMSSKEFTSNTRIPIILTQEEQLELLRCIITREQTSVIQETTLPFDKMVRSSSIPTLRLLNGIEIVRNRPFVCDGRRNDGLNLKVNQDMEVLGVGFLGPIDSDSFYDVTVDISYYDGSLVSCGRLDKRVFARKNEAFYVSFDEPIKIYAHAAFKNDSWRSEHYYLTFSLKGLNTSVPELGSSSKNFRIETDEGIGFSCEIWNTPFAELRFKKC